MAVLAAHTTETPDVDEDRLECACGETYISISSWAWHVAEAVEAEHLVIPRSDIVTEYGVQTHWTDTTLVEVCRSEDVARYRSERIWSGRPVVSRETWSSPWTPHPAEPAPVRCSDCGYPEGRQPDCDTCKGVPISPAPLLEDGAE
ncbi:hypothetical protein FG87_21935 [Nocardia vulneris]|uniref:Uncharacterized protein n=2 Tax=Nocardia vulneris TaxID=1141657 RepID=A0ABR4ZCE8_9NOCA|nr:hypothetical protein FG87_21935 [Nocardia vulneris]